MKKFIFLFLSLGCAQLFSMQLEKREMAKDWLEEAAECCCEPAPIYCCDTQCGTVPLGCWFSSAVALVVSSCIGAISTEIGVCGCVCCTTGISLFACAAQCHKNKQQIKREKMRKMKN